MKRKTTEQFINDSKEVHGDKYDYSLVDYKNISTKVKIICSIHGIFEQVPRDHLYSKRGCVKCGKDKISIYFSSNKDEWLEKVLKVHDTKYDYSNFLYVKSWIKGEIICKKHGSFWQTPNKHLTGRICPKCSIEIKSTRRLKTTEDFINSAKSIHGDKYDYSLVNYKGSKKSVKIICLKHGIFKQSRDSHIGRGDICPKCANRISKPEVELQNFVKEIGFEIITNSRRIIKPYELDIYIPKFKKAIEFNGKYWHYGKNFVLGKHANKSNLCRERGIKLLHVREDLWLKDKEKMKKVIIKFLKNV